jgi:hypothetical protein
MAGQIVKRPFEALEGRQARLTKELVALVARCVDTGSVCGWGGGQASVFCRQERWILCVETATAKAVQISILVRGRQAELTKELAALKVFVCVRGGGAFGRSLTYNTAVLFCMVELLAASGGSGKWRHWRDGRQG